MSRVYSIPRSLLPARQHHNDVMEATSALLRPGGVGGYFVSRDLAILR